MKKKVLFLTLVISAVGFCTYGFLNKESVKINDEVAITVPKTPITIDLLEKETILKEEDLYYSVGARFKHSITPEKLKQIKLIRNIVPDYPVNWVTEYEEIEVLINHKGEEIKVKSTSEEFTKAQKELFSVLNVSDAIHFNIKYKEKSTSSNKLEPREMHLAVTVVPNTPAEYIGGYEQMMSYLKRNSTHKIVGKIMENLKFTRLDFLVNTDGKVEDVILKDSSGDSELDKLLLKLISKMPKWHPAKNADGTPAAQRLEFILTFGDKC